MLFWLPMVIRHYRDIPAGRNIWRDASVPAACHTLGQIGWGLAPYFNDASVMNFVSRISFLFTVVAGFWLVAEERSLARRPLFWVGSAGTVAGLLAMFSGGRLAGNTSALGIGVLVFTALFWALYSVSVRRRMQGYSNRLAFGVVSVLVAPSLTLLMLALGDWRAVFRLGALDALLLVLSAWLAIAWGHVLYYQVIHHLGPIVGEGGLALLPFLTALLAHAILGERLLRGQWIGGILLVASSLCLLLAKARVVRLVITDEPAGG
jgi:drug/metabolite transporter (DMT)-like permease